MKSHLKRVVCFLVFFTMCKCATAQLPTDVLPGDPGLTVGLRDYQTYPNPTTGFLYISLAPGVGHLSLQVVDDKGKVILQQKIQLLPMTQIVSLDLSSYHNGAYLLQFAIDKTFKVKRVMLNR